MLALIIIYAVGWAICSLFFGFGFLMTIGFAQDNMDTFYSAVAKMFFVSFFGIWFWPIAVPILIWNSNRDMKRTNQRNKEYWAKIEAGENFGKRMVISDVPSFLADYVNTEVTVVRWEVPGNFGMKREVRPVTTWPNGNKHDMVWSAESLTELND